MSKQVFKWAHLQAQKEIRENLKEQKKKAEQNERRRLKEEQLKIKALRRRMKRRERKGLPVTDNPITRAEKDLRIFKARVDYKIKPRSPEVAKLARKAIAYTKETLSQPPIPPPTDKKADHRLIEKMLEEFKAKGGQIKKD